MGLTRREKVDMIINLDRGSHTDDHVITAQSQAPGEGSPASFLSLGIRHGPLPLLFLSK